MDSSEQNDVMEEFLVELGNQKNYTDKELFTKVWLSPRLVFEYITRADYQNNVTLLLVLASISNSLANNFDNEKTFEHSVIYLLAVSIIGGGIFGWIGYYILGALISWTGRWINGVAETYDIVRVLSYAMIPNIMGTVLLVFIFVVNGGASFEHAINFDGSLMISISIILATVLLFVLQLWSLILSVVGVAVVQRFSIPKSILNILLVLLVIIAFFIIVLGIFSLFRLL